MQLTESGVATPARPSRGFTLVEVLVALAIACTGLLGLALLTLGGLQTGRVARDHDAAVRLLDDLAERIRANPGAAASYALDDAQALDPPVVACVLPTACTATQFAAAELYEWQQRLWATLPDAHGSVVVAADAHGRHTCTLTLRWTVDGGARETLVATVLA